MSQRLLSKVAVGLISVALASAPALASTGEEPRSNLGDVGSYANEMDISPDEAVNRLDLQTAAGDLDASLTSSASEVFAGLWIEHQPDFHVVVLLTDPAFDIAEHVRATGLDGRVEIRTADRSLRQLEADAKDILRNAGPGIRPFDLNIDVFRNEITLEVASIPSLDAFLDQRDLQLPDTAKVILVEDLAQPTANIYGGLALSPCTSGFSVKNSAGTKGILTAGHCSDSVTRSGTSLPFKDEALGGSHDEQWHTAPGFTVKNWATDGVNDSTPYYKVITGTISRSNQALNSWYCKYGKNSLYACGYLISKTRAPGYVPNANATFMELHRDGVDLCDGGDSGGPVYTTGSNALGIISGAAGSGGIHNCFYTAINYVTSGLSVSVLTS